ncbi:hypothetical protein ACLMJK_005824 [Lecanora helva]
MPKLPGTDSNTAAAATSDAAASTKAADTSKGQATDTKSTAKAAKTTAAAGTTSSNSAKPTSTKAAKASSTDPAALSGLPKLAQDNYPAPTVPPTAGAPFMQKSNLPEGTVFICVGAALGFVGFLVLAWRGLVAWSLRRSVKKVAIAQSAKYSRLGDSGGKSAKTKSPYFNPGAGSTLSLDQLGALGAGGKGAKHKSGHGSLFFSPTAGGSMQAPNNRGSGYLPAGYYAAGNQAPGGGSGMTHLGGGGGAIGLSTLGPQTHRYSRARSTGPSPPGSPSLPPSRGRESTQGGRHSTAGLSTQPSNMNLNVSSAPQGRAPSAFLEDLFANHPPGTPPPPEENNRRGSNGRF